MIMYGCIHVLIHTNYTHVYIQLISVYIEATNPVFMYTNK